MFFVYILQSGSIGRYYVGSTKDLNQRLAQHNVGMMKATKANRPWRAVYVEECATLGEARKREALIKSWKSPGYLRKTLGI